MGIIEQKGNSILIAFKADDIPEEIQVLPFGELETEKGKFVVDEEAARLIISEFEKQKNDMVIDYEHQTLQGTEAPAAGWIKKLFFKGKDGIWAKVEWTPRAKEYLKNKEYRYVSPVFLKRVSDNKVIKLINVALTNQPAIDGMVPVVNKETNKEDEMEEILKLLNAKDKDEAKQKIEELIACKQDMDKTKKELEEIGKLKADLGLDDNAKLSELRACVLAMKQGGDTAKELAQKVALLEQKLKEKEAKELVEMAMKEGKILPAQKEWALKYAAEDPEGFKVFVAKSPKVVEFGKVTEEEQHKGTDGLQMQINKMLGLDDETFKKYGNIKEE